MYLGQASYATDQSLIVSAEMDNSNYNFSLLTADAAKNDDSSVAPKRRLSALTSVMKAKNKKNSSIFSPPW